MAIQRNNSDSRNLHTQIEDLLVALSDLQRQHALLADQLQKEREEREEDRTAVRTLLDGLKKKASSETVVTAQSGDSQETLKPFDSADNNMGTNYQRRDCRSSWRVWRGGSPTTSTEEGLP